MREMLLRRPCTQQDIVDSLGIAGEEVTGILGRLIDLGLVERQTNEGDAYYRARGERPTLLR